MGHRDPSLVRQGRDPQNTSKVVLVVHGETAQYWNAPSKPALAVGLLKGLLTDEKPASESGTTKL